MTESQAPGPGDGSPASGGGGGKDSRRAALGGRDIPPADFRFLFESAPGCFLVVTPDTFEIVAVSDAYVQATRTSRELLLGRTLFEAFPDEPGDESADGTRNLRQSLQRVVESRSPDTMAVQRYPIPVPEGEGRHAGFHRSGPPSPGGDCQGPRRLNAPRTGTARND